MHIGRMGRFSAILFLLLGACGDNLDDVVVPEADGDDIEVVTAETVPTRLVPAVCGAHRWSAEVSPKKLNLSIAGRDRGAAVIATRPGDGSPIGYGLDVDRHDMVVNTIVLPNKYEQVIATQVGERLVSTAVQNGEVDVHLLDPDFGNPQYTATLPGGVVAEPALYAMGATELVMPVITDDGLWLHRFQDSFEPIDSVHVVKTAAATSMAAAQVRERLLTVWSTADECYLSMTGPSSAAITARKPMACPNPRVAVNQHNGEMVVLFDHPEGVGVLRNRPAHINGEMALLRSVASSPRALFDGERIWVSYLDVDGTIVVGFFDEQGLLLKTSLEETQLEPGAYDFVMVDGQPWVYSLTDRGFAAHQMCAGVED